MVVMAPGGQGLAAIHRHWGGRRVTLGTRFAQVELHRKIDGCTQLH